MVEQDGFEIVDGPLPHRPSTSASTTPTVVVEQGNNSQTATVDVHSDPQKHALLVSVNPPAKPQSEIPHAPCDVVLVVDISASMRMTAALPREEGSKNQEESGLSVLDLTKHAAKTIIETLNEKDRLAIVTFCEDARLAYELSGMTKEKKAEALQELAEVEALGSTNLWHGLKTGLQVLYDADPIPENTPALFVLTDGKPNVMNPPRGFVPKLRKILREHRSQNGKSPLINTFGFGYQIRSGLLESISEVGDGNFGFIPDSGMLGTVLIHAIANLYTTYATQARLTIRGAESLNLSSSEGFTTGIQLEDSLAGASEFSVDLGSLHYGQSRDILLSYEDTTTGSYVVEATVSYSHQGKAEESPKTTADLTKPSSMPLSAYHYHSSRARICAFLRSVYSLDSVEEYIPLESVQQRQAASQTLEDLANDLKSAGHTDEQNASLIQDLVGVDSQGQVCLALWSMGYFLRWGRHYLLSLLNAHTHQICNSFKDPGPLQYGKDSTLFCRCRDELDDYFDNLPPPKPSTVGIPRHASGRGMPHASFQMSAYRRASAPCFAGHCAVRLADNDHDDIAIRDVRAGMALWTPCGPHAVKAVLATPVRDAALCRLGPLCITPWHPVMAGDKWMFPCQVDHEPVRFSGTVYSVLLERSSSSDAHAISVEGRLCVTLGHGVTVGSDVRAHAFFGSYSRVARSLDALPRDGRGVYRSWGIKRDPRTRLVCSFVGPGKSRARVGKGVTLPSRKRSIRLTSQQLRSVSVH